MPERTLLLFDIGGVLLSNGWDHAGRRAAAARFGLDADELERRHAALAELLETGRLDWPQYLAATVFDVPRTFGPAAFRQFVWDRSTAYEAALAAGRSARRSGRYLVAALNNESRELNDYRIDRFGLRELFDVFFSSCYTGRRKPSPEAYRFALDLARRSPQEALFFDDRPENVEAAAAVGIPAVRVRDPARLREDLLAAGVSLA